MGRVFLDRSAGGRLVAVKVIKDELAIATASVEHTVSLWDAANGRELVRWPHDSPVTAVTFSPDSTRLITGSADRTIRLWDLASGAQISRVEHDEIRVFSPDRTQLATGRRSVVRLLDLVTRAELARIPQDNASPNMAFSPDGAQLITREGNTVALWAT